MEWKFDKNKPIYSQIIDQISGFIAAGEFESGSRLPSVRDMAQAAGVNPNTMQRALSQLEATGLVYSDRTRGRFITEDKEIIKKAGAEKAKVTVAEFLTNMKQIGYSKEETIELIKNYKGDDVCE